MRWTDVAPSLQFGASVQEQEAWPGYLEDLEHTFSELREETRELSLERTVEHAAARLLPVVVERTYLEDAWYMTLVEALGWYLEDRVRDVTRVSDVVDEVISGRFSSWIAPTDDVARQAFAELGKRVVAIETSTHDAIAEWTPIRRSAFLTGDAYAPRTEPVPDGHARYIDEVDRVRDAARADRFAAALLLARDSAARGVGIGFDQLAEWQAVVLDRGAPVELRTARAFAKSGREVYELVERADFDRIIDEANDTKLSPVVRAARVYLDICFFHPFDDGNARAARLALDYVLSSAGLALRAAAPLFAISRAANDMRGAGSFAALIQRLSGTMTK